MRDLIDQPKSTPLARSLPPDVLLLNTANMPYLEGRARYIQLPRIALIITALLLAAFAVLVTLALVHANNEHQFRANGQTVQATVIDTRTSTYRCGRNGSRTCTNYYVQVQFEAANERSYRDEVRVNSAAYSLSRRNGRLLVYYDPANPADFRADGQIDETGNSFLGILVIVGIFLAIMGIATLYETQRNMRLSSRGTLLIATQPSVTNRIYPWYRRKKGVATKNYTLTYTLTVMSISGSETKEFKQTISQQVFRRLQALPDLHLRKLAVLYVNPRFYMAL